MPLTVSFWKAGGMARQFLVWPLVLVVLIANASAQTVESSIDAFVTAVTGGALHFEWTISSEWSIKNFVLLVDGTEIGTTPGTTSYALFGLTCNTGYTFQVSASFVDGSTASSLYSDVIVASTSVLSAPGIPAPPNELAVSGGFVQVSVPPPLDSGGADLSQVTVVVRRLSSSIEVLRQSLSPEESDLLVYDIYGLDAATSYQISAFATNEGGLVSPESSPAVFTTKRLQIPGPCPAPTVLSITGASIVLKLNPPRDNGGGHIQGYNVYTAATDDVVNFVEVTNTFGLDTIDIVEILSSSQSENEPLLPDTRYFFKAVAVNLVDICISVSSSLQLAGSTNSTTSAASVPGPPPSPYFLKASGGMITMGLIKPVNMQGAKLTGFLITIEDNDGTAFTKNLNADDDMTYDMAPLRASTSYTVSAAATTNLGTSSYSTSIIMGTTVASTPTPPRDIKVTDITGSRAIVEWFLPLDSGGADTTGYTLFVVSLGSQDERPASSSPAVLTNLVAETLYTVKVIATNAAEKNSSRSVGVTFKTVAPTPPSEPQGLSSIFVSGGAIEVAWNPPEDRGGESLSSMGYTTTVFSITSCFDETDADSCAGCNSVKLSVEQYQFIKSALVCEKATTSCPDSSTDCCLTRENSEFAHRMPCGRMESARDPLTVKGTTSVVYNGLNYSSTYYFGVQAINQIGKSDTTALKGLRTTSQTPPSYPSNVRQLFATGGSVQLTWDAPLDTGGSPIVGYHVYRNYELLTPSYVVPPYTDCSGMVADTPYAYGVAAVNALLVEGAMSSKKISTELLSPPLPPVLSLTGRAHNSLQVLVTPPCDTGGETSLYYHYVVKYAGIALFAANFTCCNFIVNDLKPSSRYDVFVRVGNTLSFASQWAEQTYTTTSGAPLNPVASLFRVSTYSAILALGSKPYDTEIVSYGVSLFRGDSEVQLETITCQSDGDAGRYLCPTSHKLGPLKPETEYKTIVRANGPLGSSDTEPVHFKTSAMSSGVIGMSKSDYSVDKDGVIRTLVLRTNGASGSVAVGVNVTDPDTVLLQCKSVGDQGCECTLYLATSGAESEPCSLIFVDDQESADVIFTMWNDNSAELLPSLVAVSPFGVELSGQHAARLHTEAWQQPGFVSFTKAPSAVLEDASYAMVNVVRLNGSTGIINFGFESFDMTAIAGDDYLGVKGTGVMTDQQTTSQIWIQIINNHFLDDDKTFGLRLTGQAVNDGQHIVTHSVTINDDERVLNAVPREPVSISISYATGGEFQVEWGSAVNDPAVVSGYLVSVSTASLGTFFNVYNTTASSFTLSGLPARSMYHVKVAAWNTFGLGKYSAPITVTTTDITRPGPPISLSAADVTNKQAQLKWAAPQDDGGSAILGYRVVVKDIDGNVVMSTAIDSQNTSFSVKGLIASSDYVCSVSSITEPYPDIDEALSSAVIPVSTKIGVPPERPLAVTLFAQPRGGALTFTMERPKDTGGKPLTSCTLYMRKVVEGGSSSTTELIVGCKLELTGLATPTCTASNLLAATNYEVYSVFSNAMGDSPEGERATFRTSATIDVPSPPLNLSATGITAGNIELKWDAPVDLGGAADVVGYIIYQKYNVLTSGYFTLYDGQDSKERSFTARGLTRSSVYAFAVVALNDASFCADPTVYKVSAFLEVSTLDYSRLAPPGKLFLVTSTGGAITIGWSAPDDLAGVGLGGYYVELVTTSPDDAVQLGSLLPLETTFTHYDLDESTYYNYAVTATNQDGPSERNAIFTVSTLAASRPTEVRELQYLSATGGSITFAWKSPLDSGGRDIQYYEITRDARLDNFHESATIFEDRFGLSATTTYTYKIAAFNGLYKGPTTSISFGTGPPSLPDPPQFNLAPFGGRIEVSWSVPECTGGIPIKEYTISLFSVDGLITVNSITTSALSYTFGGLLANTEYTISGKASNDVGESNLTTVAFPTGPIDDPGAPPKPTATNIRGGSVDIDIESPVYTGGEDVTMTVYMDGDRVYTFQSGVRHTAIYGLVAQTEYTFRVSASNSHSEVKGESLTISTTAISEPGQIQNLQQVSVSFSQMVLTWSVVKNTGGDTNIRYSVTYYKCNSDGVKDDLESEQMQMEDTNTILIKGLQYSSYYTVTVVAVTSTSLTGSASLPILVATEQPFEGVVVAAFSERTVIENANVVSVPITRVNGTYGSISYSFETSNGDAVAGINYVSTQGTSTLAENVKEGVIEILIINDEEYSPGISFNVDITDTNTNLRSTTRLILTDDGDAGFISFVTSTLTVYESNRTVDLVITRTGGFSPSAVIQPVILHDQSVTDRFHIPNASITFAVGDTQQLVSMEIIDDFEFQYIDDSITIGFRILEGGALYGTITSVTVTALDNGDISLPKECTHIEQKAITGGSLKLQWSPPLDRGGRDILLTYSVNINQVSTGLVRTESSATETVIVYGLAHSTSYYVSVQAVNANSLGAGSASASSMFTTPSATSPTAPLNIRVTSLSSSIAQIAWTTPLDDGGSPIIAYTIYHVVGTSLSVFNSTKCNSLTICTVCEIRQLLAQTNYNIQVRASTPFKNGAFSEILTFETPQPTIPEPPPPAVVSWTSAGAMTIQMSNPVNIGGSSIQGYQLFIRAEGDDVFSSVYHGASSEHPVYGLRYQTTYYWKYQVENAAGPSDYSPVVSNQTLAKSLPSAPLNVRESSKTGGAVTVLWDQPLDVGGREITGHTIRIVSIGDSSVNQVGYNGKGVPTREGTVYGLSANTKYGLQVVAYLDVSNCFDPIKQTWSDVIHVTTLSATAPRPAADLRVGSYTGGTIQLVWVAPKDKGGVPLTGYTLYLLDASGVASVFYETNDASVTSFVHNDLAASTSYSYLIMAFNEAGTSPNSSTLVATTAIITFPSTPLNVRQLDYNTGGAITIGWDRSFDTGGQPIGGYEVYRNGKLVSVILSAATRSFINNDGLVASTSYSFTVRTKAQNGLASMTSEECPAKTTVATKPQKAQSLTAVLGSSYVNVSWVPDGDSGGKPINAYEVRLMLGSTLVGTSKGTATFYLFKGLTASTSYTSFVKVYNDIGASEEVSASMTTTTLTKPSSPATPFGMSVFGGNFTIQVEPPELTGGSAITELNVYEYALGVAKLKVTLPVVAGGPAQYTFLGVSASTKYIVACSAVNSAGEGVLSENTAIQTTTINQPGLILLAPVLTGASGTTLSIRWAPPIDTGGSLELSYFVRIANSSFEAINPSINLGFTAIQLAYNSPYAISVSASNNKGNGTWSPVRVASTLPDTAGEFSFARTSVSVIENANQVALLVQRTSGLSGRITLTYKSEVIGTRPATVGSDYAITKGSSTTTGTIVFEPLQSQNSIVILILNDEEYESPDETFGVRIISLVSSEKEGTPKIGTNSLAIVTIVDDGDAGFVSFEKPNYSFSEDARSATISIIREYGKSTSISLGFEFWGGTATLDADYRKAIAPIVMENGVTMVPLTFTIVNDKTFEFPDEFFFIEMTVLSGGAKLRQPLTRITIVDDGDISNPGTCPPPLLKSRTGGSATFATDYPDHNGSAVGSISKYVVRLSTEKSSIDFIKAVASTFTIGSLTASISYNVSIAAISLFGNGTFSSITSFSTTSPTPPGAISSLSVESKTGGRISFVWSSPDDSGGVAITKYRVYTNSKIAAENLQPVTRATAYGLTANTAYNFSVQAGHVIDGADTWGEMSGLFQFTTAAVTQAGPLVVHAEPYNNATGGKVYLSWQAPLDTGGTRISSYSIFASSSSRPWFLAASVSPKPDSLFVPVANLNASTAYKFFVLAINEVGAEKLPANLSIAEGSQIMRTTSDLSSWLSVGSVIAVQDTWFIVGDVSSVAAGSIILKNVHSAASIVSQPGVRLGQVTTFSVLSTTAPQLPDLPPPPTLSISTGGMINMTLLSPEDTGGIPILGFSLFWNGKKLDEDYYVKTTSKTNYLQIRAFVSVARLKPSTSYKVSAVALNSLSLCYFGKATTGPNATFSTTTVTPPGAPQLVAYRRTGGGITMTLTDPHDIGGNEIQRYWMYYKLNGTTDAWQLVHAGPKHQATVAPLKHLTDYAFLASISNGFFSSVNSSVRVVTTTNKSPPGACDPPWRVNSTGGMIALSWNYPPDDGGSVVTDFYATIASSLDGSGRTTVRTQTTSAVFYRLLADSSYDVVIRANNSFGFGPESVIATFKTEAATPPEGDIKVTVQRTTGGAASISFDEPIDLGGALPSDMIYNFYLDGDNIFNMSYLSLESAAFGIGSGKRRLFEVASRRLETSLLFQNIHVGGMDPETLYGIQVRPISKYASGGTSATFAIETTTPTSPTAPVDLTTDLVTGGAVSLSWGPPADSGGIPLNNYSLSMSSLKDGPFAEVYKDMGRATYIELLRPSTKYWVYVTAVNDHGLSPRSSILEFSTRSITPPSAPQDLQIVSVAANSIDCTWHVPRDVGGDTIDSYIVTVVKMDDPNAVAPTFTAKSTSATLNQLASSTAYSISVTAVNTFRDVGAASFVRYATTSSANKLAAPQIGCVSRDSVELLWYPYTGATSYDIFRDGIKVANSLLSPIVVNNQGLSAGTAYQYTIQAVTSTGSFSSDPATVTTLDASYTSTDTICRGDLGHIKELNYANNVKRQWRIDPTTPFTYITLTFSSFMLECDHDYVELIDASTKVRWWKGGCERVGHFVFQAKAPIIITFKSDDSIAHDGFELQYQIDGSADSTRIPPPGEGSVCTSHGRSQIDGSCKCSVGFTGEGCNNRIVCCSDRTRCYHPVCDIDPANVIVVSVDLGDEEHGTGRMMDTSEKGTGSKAVKTLARAVQLSNLSMDKSFILVYPGTYSGPLNRDLNVESKDLTITTLRGPLWTSVNCDGVARFVSITSSIMTVEGITLQGCKEEDGGTFKVLDSEFTGHNLVIADTIATRNGGTLFASSSTVTFNQVSMAKSAAGTEGGALYVKDSKVIMIASSVTKSTAVRGGAVVLKGTSSMSATDTEYTENAASESGGGIFASGDISLNGVVLRRNEATNGGGLAMDNGQLTIKSCIIGANTAKAAGGGLTLSGTVTFTTIGTTIRNNVAATNGGGVYASGGTITVSFDEQATSPSSIVGNSAVKGAGMYIFNAQASLKGIRVESGLASESAGGVAVVDSTVDWASVVIQDNKAQEGGGLMLSNSRLTCKGPVFLTKNSAVDGGALWVSKGTMDGIVGTQFLSNTASKNGGAIFVVGDVTLKNMKLESHGALRGGCMYVGSAELNLVNIELTKCSASVAGGGIWMTRSQITADAASVELSDAPDGGGLYASNSTIYGGMNIKSCRGVDHGGGMYLTGNTSVGGAKVDDCDSKEGGAAYAVTAVLSLDKTSLTNSQASEKGGGLYATKSTVKLQEVDVRKDHCDLFGGGVYLDSSKVIHQGVLVELCDAKVGGGLYLLNSECSALSSSTSSRISINTALDAGGDIFLTESSSVERLVVSSGTAKSGGGIAVDSSSTAIVKGCSVANNSASFGGGLNVRSGSTCSLVDSVIETNTAEEAGGGVNIADAVIWHDGLSVSYNVAPYGAGVFVTGESRIVQQSSNSLQAVFQGNNALIVASVKGFGGGVYIAPASQLEASGLALIDGQASRGAGIYVDGAILTLTNSSFQNGNATNGGGLYASYVSKVALRNCSFIKNNASSSGGAIGSDGIQRGTNTLSMNNCSFTSNTAGFGGAITVTQTNLSGSDNVLRENSAKFGGAISVLSENSVRLSNWNFINNTMVKNELGIQGGSIYITKGTITITDSQLISNDKATLALNGGIIYVENAETTLTIVNSLLQSGQAFSGGLIYSINAKLYIKNSTLHRGFGYDFGAGIFAVNTVLDITDSFFNDNFAFYDGGAIYMSEGGSLITRNSSFDINSVQDRGGAIFLNPGAGVNCTLFSTTFTRNTNVGLGSTIFVGRKNTAKLIGCIISGNGGSGTEGGALNVVDAVVDIETSIFEFNIATRGAAIQMSRSATVAMKQTIFRNNSASAQGGALHASIRAVATFTDSTIEANYAGEGGAVYAMGSAVITLANASFYQNNAKSFGGAISMRGSAVLIAAGSSFASNKAYTGGAVSIQDNTTLSAMNNEFQNNSVKDFGSGIYIDKVTESQTQKVRCEKSRFGGNTATAGADIYWIYYPWFTFDCIDCTPLAGGQQILLSTSAVTITAGWWPPIVTSGVSLGVKVQTTTNSSLVSGATSSRKLTISSASSSQDTTDTSASFNESLTKPGSTVLWPTVVVRDYYGAIATYDNATRCRAAKSADEEGKISFKPPNWVNVDAGYVIFKDAEVLSRFRDEPYQLNISCSLSTVLEEPIGVEITVAKCNAGYENINGKCLPCEKGMYSLDGELCYHCPPGATCEQKIDSGATIGVISPQRQQGYFVSSIRSSFAASSCDDPESWSNDDPCKSIDISNLTARIHKCASENPTTFYEYWDDSRIYSCLSENEYYTCDTNTACLAANESVSTASMQSPSQCAVGYSGIVCSTCADGFYKGASGSCKHCSDPKDPVVARTTRMLAMLPMIVAVAALVFLFYLFSNTAEQRVISQAQAAKRFQIHTGQSRAQVLLQKAKSAIRKRAHTMIQAVAEHARVRKQPRTYLFRIEPRAVQMLTWRPRAEKFKIMLGFFQIIGSFKGVYEIPWPDTMSRLMDLCSLADFNFVDTTAAECLFKRDYFTNYRFSLFALLGMLLLVSLITAWGILRYRVKLSTLPRHCVMCGLPVFKLEHRAQLHERNKELLEKLKMEKSTSAASPAEGIEMEKKTSAASPEEVKSSLFTRFKSRLSISPLRTAVRTISQRFMKLAVGTLNRVDRLTQLPASISIHDPCPTSQRINNRVLDMVVHSNLRLWRARVWLRLSYKAYQNKCIKLFFWILLLFYPMLCQRVIGTFYCDEVGNHYYLRLDRSNFCYEGTWLYYLPLNLALIIIWVVGVPLLFWVIISLKRTRGVQDILELMKYQGARKQRMLLKLQLDIIDHGQIVDEEKLKLFETEMLEQYLRDRNLNEPSTVAQVGFIYHSYNTAFWWFEVWELGRKLLLNCIVSLLAKAGANRIICGLVVLLAYLSVMLFYKPYRDPTDSALAGVTYIQLFITLFCGLILKMGSLYLDKRVVHIVTDAAVFTTVLTLGYAVFSILEEKRNALKAAELQSREDHRRAIAKHVRKLWRVALNYAVTQNYLSDPDTRPMSLLVMTELARRERRQKELDDLNAQLELTSAINPPIATPQQQDVILSTAEINVLVGEHADNGNEEGENTSEHLQH